MDLLPVPFVDISAARCYRKVSMCLLHNRPTDLMKCVCGNVTIYSVCSLLIIYAHNKRDDISLCLGSEACALYGHMTAWCADQRATAYYEEGLTYSDLTWDCSHSQG